MKKHLVFCLALALSSCGQITPQDNTQTLVTDRSANTATNTGTSTAKALSQCEGSSDLLCKDFLQKAVIAMDTIFHQLAGEIASRAAHNPPLCLDETTYVQKGQILAGGWALTPTLQTGLNQKLNGVRDTIRAANNSLAHRGGTCQD